MECAYGNGTGKETKKKETKTTKKQLLVERLFCLYCLACLILSASPVCPTLGSFKASTSLVQVGGPVSTTRSTFSSHPASMSARKVGESVMVFRRL